MFRQVSAAAILIAALSFAGVAPVFADTVVIQKGTDGPAGSLGVPPGNGGDGDIVDEILDFDGGNIVLVSRGGLGGDAFPAEGDDGGKGGDGGIIRLITTTTTTGSAVADASGGDGGAASIGGANVGGLGGRGGVVQVILDGDVTSGVFVDISGGADGKNSAGTSPGTTGLAGVAQVLVGGSIGKLPNGRSIDVDASGGQGVVQVVVAAGVKIDGLINVNGAMVSQLAISGYNGNRNLARYIRRHPNAGTLRLGGGINYSYSGFTQIVVPDRRGGSKGTTLPDTPDYFVCTPRDVIAINDKGLRIIVNARNPNGKGRFHVGDIVDGIFVSTNPLHWTVEAKGSDGSSFVVLNAEHEVVATCKG
jgi:hypothetical protein